MTFDEWFNSEPHRMKYDKDHPAYLAAHEAWTACQQYTLMTIEEACKAQVAYDQGFKDGRERFEVHIAGYVLSPGLQPGMIWIEAASGEGGDFHIHELAEAIGKFYREKF